MRAGLPTIELETFGPAATVGAVGWSTDAGPFITVVARATIPLIGAGPTSRIASPLAMAPLVVGSAELAPFLPCAQLTLVGRSRAPADAHGLRRGRVTVRRGTSTILDKTVVLRGAVSEPTTALAPLPAESAQRRSLLAGHAVPPAQGAFLPQSFDPRWFLDAPHDQWIVDLAVGDVIGVAGFGVDPPGAPNGAQSAVIPAWDLLATWRLRDGQAADVALLPQCVAVDTDSDTMSITWRAISSVPVGASAEDLAIQVTVAPRARSVARTRVLAARDDDPSVDATPASAVLDPSPPARPLLPFARMGPSSASASWVGTPSDPTGPPVDLETLRRALSTSSENRAWAEETVDELPPGIAPPARLAPVTGEYAIAGRRASERAPSAAEGPLCIPTSADVVVPPARLAEPLPAGPDDAARVAALVERLLAGRLTGEALREASLDGARLEGAELARRDLRGACMPRAVLARADLRGARLDGADLSGADLRGADLGSASLDGADLSRAQLQGATLDRANLTRCRFGDARLDGASLRSAVLDGALGDGATLVDADLEASRGKDVALRRADLTRARLVEVDWLRADLDRALLNDAVLARALLREARLGSAQLERADLRSATLRGATLRAARCEGAVLDGADLREVDALDAIFDPAALARARTDGMTR